jgi:hypothetical protein
MGQRRNDFMTLEQHHAQAMTAAAIITAIGQCSVDLLRRIQLAGAASN